MKQDPVNSDKAELKKAIDVGIKMRNVVYVALALAAVAIIVFAVFPTPSGISTGLTIAAISAYALYKHCKTLHILGLGLKLAKTNEEVLAVTRKVELIVWPLEVEYRDLVKSCRDLI